MDLDLAEVTRDVRRLVEAQGERVMSGWSTATPAMRHDRRDFSTEVDFAVESALEADLAKRFPDHGIQGEETAAVNPDSAYQWLIDPIDGTKYYAGGSSLFAISVGLLFEQRPVLGVVYSPPTGQCFHAWEGGGAFLGSRRLRVAGVERLEDAIVDVDTPGSSTLSAVERAWYERKLIELDRAVYRVRALGIGSLAACWLASGAFDGYVDLTGRANPEDLAAGRVVMQEAGARVEAVDPGVGPPRLVAAPPAIWESLRRVIVAERQGRHGNL